jgi:hypothetical protein
MGIESVANLFESVGYVEAGLSVHVECTRPIARKRLVSTLEPDS